MGMQVRAKKSLGQHFLKDQSIATKIVDSLILTDDKTDVLEVGPGMGVLTQYLLKIDRLNLLASEVDRESILYLKENYPEMTDRLIEGDFLRLDLDKFFKKEFFVIGNFPYNISSQIFFKVLDYRDKIPQVVGMVQKEVAERLASPPGNKSYGILSVLLQAWYDIEYLFTVNESVFSPPPKVKSAVIRLTRNSRTSLDCDEKLFKAVVKGCFNQRRKTIRNSIRPLLATPLLNGVVVAETELLTKRPEQLSVEEFVQLTNSLCR